MHRSSLAVGTMLMAVAIVADRLTKFQIKALLSVGESQHVAGPISFTHVENTGSVFGLGQGYVLIPTIGTLVILAIIPVLLRHLHIHHGYTPTVFQAGCLGLIAGGAVGNLYDRIVLSAVTDFVDIEVLPGVHYPVFNVADICVVCGTILLMIAFLRHEAGGVGHDVPS